MLNAAPQTFHFQESFMNRTVLITFVITFFSLLMTACQSANTVAPDTVAATPAATATPTIPWQHEDIVVGEGVRAKWGGEVSVKYVGKLTNGTVFDEGKVDFKVGDQTIIKGFNLGVGGSEGVEAMKVGGKRKITLPPALGYGAEGDGKKIPPNATIIFELELLKASGKIGF
jgi:FKBP-type peptidyl-prolyl cis-trans isomerase FkpA